MGSVKTQAETKEEKNRKNIRSRKQVTRTILQDESDTGRVEDLTQDSDGVDDSDAACFYCNE